VEPNADAEVNGADAKPEAPDIRGTQYWLMKAEPESRIVKGKV